MPGFVRTYGFARTSGSVAAATLAGLEFDLGDVAVITLAWYNTMTDAITVADDAAGGGNVWQKVPYTFQQGSGGANPPGQQLWWAIITKPGTSITITATFPATAYYPAIYGCEISGANSIDQSAGAQGTGAESSGNITTTKPSTFIYGSVYDGNGASSGGGAGGGWTTIQDTYGYYLNLYQIASSVGTFAATSNDAGSFVFTAAIVAFFFAAPPTLPAAVVCIME
jgi:hypothetical protein